MRALLYAVAMIPGDKPSDIRTQDDRRKRVQEMRQLLQSKNIARKAGVHEDELLGAYTSLHGVQERTAKEYLRSLFGGGVVIRDAMRFLWDIETAPEEVKDRAAAEQMAEALKSAPLRDATV